MSRERKTEQEGGAPLVETICSSHFNFKFFLPSVVISCFRHTFDYKTIGVAYDSISTMILAQFVWLPVSYSIAFDTLTS